ncbi:MAG: hypothetical protein J6V32_02485 [Elusimicrobiaceae bacterium]|nr:hypothetical protein [Elusimicrobiaceae bacterium]
MNLTKHILKRVLIFSFLLTGLFQSSSAQVGKEALEQFGKWMSRGNKIHTIPVGNYKFKLPPAVSKMCIKESVEGYFLDGALNYKDYPKLSAKNDARTFRAVHKFADLAVEFENNYVDILSQIEGHVEQGKIQYKNWLPKDPGIIYIGEVHNQSRIHQEVTSLLKQLPSIYPGKRIYLATEFVPASQLQLVQSNLIFTPAELNKRLLEYDVKIPSTRVISSILKNNILVYGLEDYDFMYNVASHKGVLPVTQDRVYDFATSFEGMHLRNKIFARKIQELRAFDPEGLIVVYAGISHVSYHELGSVPSLLKEKSFVIQMTVPPALIAINPLYSYLKQDSNLRDAFRASDNAKMINSWKTPSLAHRRILGNDLTIILHE